MGKPSVTVVVPAHARPVELRRVIAAVLAQDYEGELSVCVVYDRASPDRSLAQEGERPVHILANNRTPGLAGARNTGILAAQSWLVAFCDDDDYWVAHKLTRQVALLEQTPGAPLVSSGILVENQGRLTSRLAEKSQVTHSQLVRSRMSMMHSSTFVFRRHDLVDRVGLIDEKLPRSQSEDWDILLRSSKIHPVLVVDEPLVTVTWGQKSFYRHDWDTKIASNQYLLAKHSDVAADSRAAARLMGKIAFASACSGQRRQAWRWAAKSFRSDPRQWRAVLSSAVAIAPTLGRPILDILNRYGRGV